MKQTLLLLLALICLNAKAVTPDPFMTMTTSNSVGQLFTFSLRADVENTVVQVDFGNGTLVNKTIGTSSTDVVGLLVGSQTVKIYGGGINFLLCYNGNLTAIDVTHYTALQTLACSSNQLTSLDLTQNTSLQTLYCFANKLTSLDVSMNKNLKNLYCDFNKLTSLDVTQNTELIELYCSDNPLTSLDVSKNTVLQTLYCPYCQLTSLDVDNNTALQKFYCNSNHLTSIDVTNNAALELLYVDSNQLTFATLPLSKSTTFTYAPQSAITIATSFAINTPIDLSSQLTANGNTTTYTWKTESGTTLTAGTDYTIDGGKTTFKTIPAEKVYCEMTNATFPDLSGTYVLKTTLTTIVSSTATAIEDAKADAFDIYTRNQTVNLSLPQAAMVQVYDITGHLVNAEYYNSGNNSFEVANKGIYVIKVNMNDQVVSKKIVIK